MDAGEPVKIAILGAGSLSFISNLVRDLALAKDLYGSTVELMDINPSRLERSYSFMKKYFAEAGASYSVEMTTDRAQAVREADFVLNIAFPIGYDNYGKMMEVAEKHGYYRGLDATEWNMVNVYAIYTGYEVFEAAMRAADDVEELAPDAWFVQMANPVFEVSTLLGRTHPKLKVVGYCHGAPEGAKLLTTRALGLDFDDVEFKAAGFNHTVFLSELKYRGEDAYHLVDEWLEQKAEDFWKREVIGPWEETLSKAAADMYKTYGQYPLGDTARSGTWKYHWDLKTKQKWYGPLGGVDSEIGWALRLYLRSQEEKREDVLVRPDVRATEKLPPQKSGEAAIDFIQAVTGRGKRVVYLNVRNDGVIPGVAADVFVEVPVQVDEGKLEPERVALSDRIRRLVLPVRLEKMERSLDAYVTGDKQDLVEVLLEDPRTNSPEQAKDAIDEVLSLPFNENMRKHFEK